MSTTDQTYKVVRPIAEGGMGRVELAVRKEGEFRRVFALKRLKGALEEDAAAQTMFLEEARLAGLLRHPNVVSVLDVGRDERGAYLVMDFIEGLSVSKLLSAAGRGGRMVPVQVIVRIMLDVIRGLDAAHGLASHDGKPMHMVHRDISPQNILIGFDGVARLTDFGIAKAIGSGSDTTTGILKGKAGYMSPEQFRFQDPDQRSDLFSFGVVLVEMLVGRRIYKAESLAASARRILEEPPPDVEDARDDVPPTLVELCFALLAKDPEHRPANARQVGRTLNEVLNELVSDEGVIEVRDYLDTHHDAERVALKDELASAWGLFDSIPPIGAPKKTDRRLLAGLGAAALVGAIVAGVVFARDNSVDAVAPPSSAPDGQTAPVDLPTAANEPPAPVVVLEAPVEEPVEEEPVEEVVEAATMDEPSRATTMRRRVSMNSTTMSTSSMTGAADDEAARMRRLIRDFDQ